MKGLKYYLAALSAFVLWGFFSLALRPLKDYPDLDVLFYRAFFSFVLVTIINFVFRRNIVKDNMKSFVQLSVKDKKQAVFITAIGGVLLAFNWYIFIYVINHVSVSSGAFGYLLCPICTTVLAFITLKEKLTKLQWISVGISVLGCALMGTNSLKDFAFSMMVAVSYAFFLISQRQNKVFDSLVTVNLHMFVMCVIFLPLYPFVSGPIPVEPVFYICLAIIVLLLTVLPLYLNLYALTGINSSSVGIMLYINPIINFILAILYYKEAVSTQQYLSFGIILCSVIVFNAALFFPAKVKENKL